MRPSRRAPGGATVGRGGDCPPGGCRAPSVGRFRMLVSTCQLRRVGFLDCGRFAPATARVRPSDKLGKTMNDTYLIYIACSILSFVPALVLHEVAHGFALPQARRPHRQRAGTSVVESDEAHRPVRHGHPAASAHAAGLAHLRLRRSRFRTTPYFRILAKGDFIVGIAGPLSNLAMAGVAGLLAHLLLGPYLASGASVFFDYFYTMFLPMFALVNLYLMFFNLLPIPPLDGSSVFALLVPRRYLGKYYSFSAMRSLFS